MTTNYLNNFLNSNSKKTAFRNLEVSGKEIGIIVYCSVVFILVIISSIYLYKKFKEFLKKFKNKKLLKEHRKHLLFQAILIPQIYEKEEEEVCAICLQNLKIKKSKVCFTNCKHVFHFYCLKKYVLNSDKTICPLCKEDLFKDTKFDMELVAIVNAQIIPLDEKDNPINELNQEEIKVDVIYVQNKNNYNESENNNENSENNNNNNNNNNDRNAYQNSEHYVIH
jgi:hypothetical protein